MKKQNIPTKPWKIFLGRHFRINQLTLSDYFAISAVGVLLATTIYWALLSARVGLHNADQLVDEFLFENGATFHASVFPDTHSFLLKWPIFALIKLIGINEISITVATVILTLATVGLLAFFLYRIERRPAVFGILCLALASTLLLVPAESYPGALLPVNMAMISTRNIEYIIYIAALALIIRTPRFFHWKVLVATILFSTLIASDKLFLAFTMGGAGIMFILSFLNRYKGERRFSLVWLLSGATSVLLALFGLWLIKHFNLVILGNSNQAGPYGLVHSLKDAVIGSIYALLGLFTNLGANPAFDTMIVKQIPVAALHRLVSVSGVGFIINAIVALFGIFAIGKIISHKQRPSKVSHIDQPLLLARALIWTTLVAVIIFIVSDHYYPADARYLAIFIPTVFISVATYLRTVKFTPRALKITVSILTVSILAGIAGAAQQTSQSNAYYAQTAIGDSKIAAALTQHPVTMLLGDYWRVMPIKLQDKSQAVVPLSDCFTPRDTLLSHAWQSSLTTNSFAYIASLKPSVTGFPTCSIDKVVSKYGRPNSSQLIAGTVTDPDEVLLFYDYGSDTALRSVVQKHAPAQSILPHPIAEASRFKCSSGHSVMNIIAHQDDDLLFINPDTYHELKAGNCVHAVYVTAGDAGNDQLYWLSREEGSKAAYATMLGIANPVWITRTASISNTAYVTVSFMQNNPQVSLVFMHLPDGDPSGNGFPSTHHESLQRLRRGNIPMINTVDNQSHYTSEELISALTTLMGTYQPLEVHTQAMQNHSKKHPDHSDHLTTGWYANQAYLRYHQTQPDATIGFYIGYPKQDFPITVFGNDLAVTDAAFFAYAQHDNGTCESVTACSKMSYGKYLNRQYRE